MAFRDATTNSGTGATEPSTAVPAGVQIDDIVILVASVDGNNADFAPGDWPTGFTELFEQATTADGQKCAVGWKRLTAVDSGSYTFTGVNVDAFDWICQAAAFSGRSTTSNPTGSSANSNTANPNPVSVNAATVTALDGDDLCWVGAPDVDTTGAGNGMAPPTNYLEREDAELGFQNLSIATRDNAPAGATGTVTGTFTITSGGAGWAAFLIRIPSGDVTRVPLLARYP